MWFSICVFRKLVNSVTDDLLRKNISFSFHFVISMIIIVIFIYLFI